MKRKKGENDFFFQRSHERKQFSLSRSREEEKIKCFRVQENKKKLAFSLEVITVFAKDFCMLRNIFLFSGKFESCFGQCLRWSFHLLFLLEAAVSLPVSPRFMLFFSKRENQSIICASKKYLKFCSVKCKLHTHFMNNKETFSRTPTHSPRPKKRNVSREAKNLFSRDTQTTDLWQNHFTTEKEKRRTVANQTSQENHQLFFTLIPPRALE